MRDINQRIVLRIQKFSNTNSSDEEDRAWEAWQLKFGNSGSTKEVTLQLPDQSTGDSHASWKDIKCSESKIEQVPKITSGHNRQDINSTAIKFELSKQCSNRGAVNFECDINFIKSNNLKWGQDFQPKITFSAF